MRGDLLFIRQICHIRGIISVDWYFWHARGNAGGFGTALDIKNGLSTTLC